MSDGVACPECGLENLEEYEEAYGDEPKCPDCGCDLTEYFENYGEERSEDYYEGFSDGLECGDI